MKWYNQIRRYSLIIEKITRSKYPSIEEIRNYLQEHDEELDISQRTLERDLSALRSLGIEIEHDAPHNGYHITETYFDTESFTRFLELASTTELLSNTIMENKEALNYILFESQGNLKGIRNLKPLLFAIRNNRIIRFIHENFETGDLTEYLISPYLLKEYQGRWYVCGILENEEQRTFGIDRIEKLIVSTETYKRNEKINFKSKFEEIVGLTYSESEIQDIVLCFTPKQGKYAKALPLHLSQKTIVDNEKECIIKLRLRPNFELKQKILMLGDSVKVTEPKWLADEITAELKRMIEKYSK